MLGHVRLLAASCLFLGAVSAHGQARDEKDPLVAQALHRGALIYAYDQAAWHGTDDLRARMPKVEDAVGGWIVDGPADAPELLFFDRSGTRAVYRAQFKGTKLVSGALLGAQADGSLTPERLALIAARNTALQALVGEGRKPCTDAPFNTVVLPPEAAGAPTLVYILTPQVKNGEYPLGGHYLVEVGADGKAGPVLPFTKTCLNMAPPPDAKALMVSHLLHPVPTEVHVFTALTSRRPVYVLTTTEQQVWSVSADNGRPRIRLVKEK